jgi:F-type H+-transporting ATPase subunit epsilon
METFKLEIYTPYRLFFSEEVQAVVLRLADGEAGIYAGHSLFTAPVRTCVLRLREKEGSWRAAFVANGIIEVKRHKTVVLSDAAEWPAEIDTERAEAARKDAELSLEGSSFKFEHIAAKEKLSRAKMRLAAAAAR